MVHLNVIVNLYTISVYLFDEFSKVNFFSIFSPGYSSNFQLLSIIFSYKFSSKIDFC